MTLQPRGVLFFTPNLPYPTNFGGKVDWVQTMRHVRERGLDTYLISAVSRNDDPTSFARESSAICTDYRTVRMKHGLPRALHWQTPYYAAVGMATKEERAELRRFVEAIAPSTNAVVLEHPYVYETYRAVADCLPRRVRVTPRMHNREADFYRGLFADSPWREPRKAFYLLEYLRMSGYETRVMNSVDQIACVSATDARHVAAQGHRAEWCPVVLPPPSSSRSLTPAEALVFADLRRTVGARPVLLFASSFIGGFNVRAVRWFKRRVLPQVRSRIPDVLFLYGGLRAAEHFADSDDDSELLFSDVPSVRPYLETAEVALILTFSAAGVKLKLLDALAQHKRIVSMDEGVIGSGLEAAVPHSSDPRRLADLCVDALHGRLDFTSAFDLMHERYDSHTTAAQLLAFISGDSCS